MFFFTDKRCLERRDSFGWTPLPMTVDAQDSSVFLLELPAGPAVLALGWNSIFPTTAAHADSR